MYLLVIGQVFKDIDLNIKINKLKVQILPFLKEFTIIVPKALRFFHLCKVVKPSVVQSEYLIFGANFLVLKKNH